MTTYVQPLPPSDEVTVERLSSVFQDCTNSYKFFWFLAILDALRDNPSESSLAIDDVLARMVARVWYPTNYFRLSFGPQDRLAELVRTLRQTLQYPADLKRDYLVKKLEIHLRTQPKGEASRAVSALARYVPKRFIRPWFPQLRGLPDSEIDARIVTLASEHAGVLYRLAQNRLYLSAPWLSYLHQHRRILEDYCLWNLLIYLQRRNPNTPNIASKLFEPVERHLLGARKFWQLVMQRETVRCIYSDQVLTSHDCSLDHFIPWSFVTHDQLWNIVPTTQSVNSSKGDCLPDTQAYFQRFGALQWRAFKSIHQAGKSKLLEDYCLEFKADIGAVAALTEAEFISRLDRTIIPLVQVAANAGFPSGWKLK